MAKLKARLTKADWEKLPEGERSNYVAIDNGATYIPDVEPVDGWGLENIHGLKSAYDKAMAEKRSLEKQIKDGGPSEELSRELAAVKGELDALRKADPEGKLNARVAEVEKTWAQKLAGAESKFNDERGRLRSALDARVRQQGLASAFAAKKARAERIDALVQLAQGRVKMIEREDGTFEAQVFEDGGQQRASSKRTGKLSEYMGLDELAETYAKDMPEMFQGNPARGTGAENGSGGGGGSHRFSMSKAEAKANPNAYYALKAQAEAAKDQAVLTD